MSKPVNTSRWGQFWSKLPTAYRGAVILAIPIISIIPAIAGWSWSRHAKNDAYGWVRYTEKVIRESNILMRVLVDAETGIRGYTITQNPDFLEPYNRALKEIPLSLQNLKRLTTDNFQQQQLKILERQIKIRLNLLSQILTILKSTLPREQSPQLTKFFTDGKLTMDLIRDSIVVFKDEEWRLLEIRQQRLNQISNITNILIGITIISSLLGYGIAIKLYYRSEIELEKKANKLVRANKNLAETNKLVANRNRELDQFAYIISHDLKAPLRAITNLSEWIEEDLEDRLDEDTSNNMILLRNRVQRMNNFIDGLLNYSRAGRIKGETTTVNIQKLLQEIIDSIAPPPTFEIEIKEPMPVLETEILPLQQVFSNLISNSIKHHHRDRGIIIISAQANNNYYQFSVADDGAGIASEYQEKIFAIFQTLTARDNKENTGIGLSIVKKIVENRGGKIWLESELNQGTVFHFTWNK